MSRVVLASGNAGKLAELAALLAPLHLELQSQAELGVEPAPETAVTFVENALGKARHALAHASDARRGGNRERMAAIADDSGLVVPALGGEPGIRSARYAGEHATDAANNNKLRAALEEYDNDDPRRAAFFYCVMVYITEPDDPAPLVASGRWHGRIKRTPRGDNGFGYDPYFFIPELGCTSAELPAAEKNRRSHRGQASRALLTALEQLAGDR